MNNGRIRIICDLKPTGNIEQDEQIIPKIIQTTLPYHQKNLEDIIRLRNYYYNKTDIQAKQKTQQPLINNKIAIDYANEAVNTINGYSFANALTFSSRRTDNEDAMKAFNDSLDDDNYSRKLKQIALNYGICGLAYKYVIPANEEELEDGYYYKTVADLEPENTYCVYDNTIEKEKICAIHFYDRKVYNSNLQNYQSQRVYNVWTKWHQWTFVSGQSATSSVYKAIPFNVDGQDVKAYPLIYNTIPIIEYRSLDGTSYFELAIDLINAINALASARVDDVQQSVDYIILLRDIDTESDGALEKIKKCISEGILSFRSIQGLAIQPSIDVLNTKLNQSEIQTLQDFLCDKLEEILNIPNRNSKSSGGDTGSAVESRNGFRSLENKASIVTDDIIAGENDALKVIFKICNNISNCPFKNMKPKDIEIKDNRNKYENLSTASTAYNVLREAGMNDRTALEVTRLAPDSITVSKLNEQQKEKDLEFTLRKEKLLAKVNSNDIENGSSQSNNEMATNNGSNSKESENK